MKRSVIVAALVLVAGCGGGNGGGAVEVTGTTPAGVPAVTTSAPPTSSAPTPPSKQSPEATAESEETFTMPNVIGKNLQAAQDLLQSKGSYLMDQEDASGRHRLQILDRDWKVCSQIPAAGKKAPLSEIVRLAAVKLDESCP